MRGRRCAVFGRAVGEAVSFSPQAAASSPMGSSAQAGAESQLSRDRIITPAELSKHNSRDDCWVAIYGSVYDFTDFLEEHPAGVEVRLNACARLSGVGGCKNVCWSVPDRSNVNVHGCFRSQILTRLATN